MSLELTEAYGLLSVYVVIPVTLEGPQAFDWFYKQENAEAFVQKETAWATRTVRCVIKFAPMADVGTDDSRKKITQHVEDHLGELISAKTVREEHLEHLLVSATSFLGQHERGYPPERDEHYEDYLKQMREAVWDPVNFRQHYKEGEFAE
jgi:hypothetical protein